MGSSVARQFCQGLVICAGDTRGLQLGPTKESDRLFSLLEVSSRLKGVIVKLANGCDGKSDNSADYLLAKICEHEPDIFDQLKDIQIVAKQLVEKAAESNNQNQGVVSALKAVRDARLPELRKQLKECFVYFKPKGATAEKIVAGVAKKVASAGTSLLQLAAGEKVAGVAVKKFVNVVWKILLTTGKFLCVAVLGVVLLLVALVGVLVFQVLFVFVSGLEDLFNPRKATKPQVSDFSDKNGTYFPIYSALAGYERFKKLANDFITGS